ncbi:hypothetical protein AR687_10105 [Flavobacteriaceae bacterium CRH]|nr:hypothetical protein AR687_10105 [Flavobacteriaceae bacterium CRH]
MKLSQSIYFLAFFLITITSIAQNTQNFDCKILKGIKLKYVDNEDKTAYFIIKDKKHVEYLENGKYFIKSDLEWINDCEYNAKMTEITLPNFPFKVGEILNVKFDKIENQFIFGTATVRKNSFPIKFEIIK